MKRFLVYSAYVLVTTFFFIGVVSAQFGDLTEPPRLRDVEPLLVQMVYLIWALGGLLFTAVLMYIGFRYMTSGGDPQKKEEMKKRATNWIIGLLIFFGGYPVIVTVYDVLGIGENNPECYAEISTPGFHFFFPDVCTDPQSSGSKYTTSQDCGSFSQDEISTMVSQNKCCLYGNLIVTGGSCVEGFSSTFEVNVNTSGSCGATTSSCSPDYRVTGTPGDYSLEPVN